MRTATISTGVTSPEGVAAAAAGNLYVGNVYNGGVAVYAPPFSAGRAPILTLNTASTFGITIGP